MYSASFPLEGLCRLGVHLGNDQTVLVVCTCANSFKVFLHSCDLHFRIELTHDFASSRRKVLITIGCFNNKANGNRAHLSYFARTDSGQTINRFSQDLSMIDGDLPLALFNSIAS